MAQRKRMENPVVVDESIDGGGLESIFQKTAAELARLHSLSHNKKIAFDAGLKNAYVSTHFSSKFPLFDSLLFSFSLIYFLGVGFDVY